MNTFSIDSRCLRQMVLGLSLALSIGVIGCSSHDAEIKPERFVLVPPATRQLPPDPVYSRLRWGLQPQVLPSVNKKPSDNTPLILPVVHFDMGEGSVEEAAQILTATTSYSAYVSSKVGSRMITLNSLGTVNELAEEIGRLAHIDVVVDHNNKEIRFLARRDTMHEEPRFYQNEAE
ncbi:MAG: hypothetical protein KDD53_01970 [Bdellovibrionales bacterium]|nr:hypothetical protein [Bdellovibrionales bacterium]